MSGPYRTDDAAGRGCDFASDRLSGKATEGTCVKGSPSRLHFDGASWHDLTAAGQKDVRVRLELHGVSADYAARVRCRRDPSTIRCSLAPFAVRLSAHGVKTPRFLGALVRDEVSVKGEAVFTTAW